MKNRLKLSMIVGMIFFCPALFASNYYSILGIPSNATESEIKTAYRKLAMKYHPDSQSKKADGPAHRNEAKYVEIKEAYEVLGNEEKRAAYDGFQKRGSKPSLNHLFAELANIPRMSPAELNTVLKDLTLNLSVLIESENPEYYDQYDKLMLQVSKFSKFATLPILKTLLLMETTQGTIYGVGPHLNYWQSRFDTSAIKYTTGKLLGQLAARPDVNGTALLNELVTLTTTRVIIDVGNMKLREVPKFNLSMAQELYEFALLKDIVRDASSLVDFTERYVEKLLEGDVWDPVEHFLSSGLGFTLSTLAKATDSEIMYIITHLKKMDQAIVYEELFRIGRLRQMEIPLILKVLKKAKTFADYYKANPQFGKADQDAGKAIALRINLVNQAFVRDFSLMNPTSNEMSEFKKLSEFGFAQYHLARGSSNMLPARDYEVMLELRPSLPALSQQTLILLSGRTGIRCKAALQ